MDEPVAAQSAELARSGRRLLHVGALGAVVTALCCFTPALVIVLAGAGLVAWSAYLDWVLWPLLAAFVLMMVAGWLRLRRTRLW